MYRVSYLLYTVCSQYDKQSLIQMNLSKPFECAMCSLQHPLSSPYPVAPMIATTCQPNGQTWSQNQTDHISSCLYD